MTKMRKEPFLMVSGLLLAAGCGMYGNWAVGPDYQEPELPAAALPVPDAGSPTTNKTATGEFKPAEVKDDTRVEITTNTLHSWWSQFKDPILTGLVTTAVSNNLSYRVAQHRLRLARWQLMGSQAGWLPSLNGNGSFTRTRYAKNTTSAGGAATFNRDIYKAGFDASWELDVFGGVRRSVEAAEAGVDVAQCDLANAWVSLTSDIGTMYVALRTAQERLRVARTNLKLQSETYDILKSRLDSGIGDELAVNQAKYNVEQTRATIPNILAREEQMMNSLAILVGAMPGTLHATLAPLPNRNWLLEPQKISEIPLNVLRARPDVASAERALAQQVAKVGVATSLLYPKFYLNGSLGLDAIHASKFLQRNSLFDTIGPSISWPLFQGGSIIANLRAEEVKMEEAVCQYELAMQTALGEARDAYAAYTQEYHRYQSLQGAVKAATDAVNISQDLYKNGLADFNNVLDAQRSLLTLEESLTVSRGEITLDLIALYKALGGGVSF